MRNAIKVSGGSRRRRRRRGICSPHSREPAWKEREGGTGRHSQVPWFASQGAWGVHSRQSGKKPAARRRRHALDGAFALAQLLGLSQSFLRRGLMSTLLGGSPDSFSWSQQCSLSILPSCIHSSFNYPPPEYLLWIWVLRLPIKMTFLVTKLCPTLCHPIDYRPSGYSVHRISQARILEWVAISFSRISSQTRDQTWVSCIQVDSEPPGKSLYTLKKSY